MFVVKFAEDEARYVAIVMYKSVQRSDCRRAYVLAGVIKSLEDEAACIDVV
jgi:hypothetical protein